MNLLKTTIKYARKQGIKNLLKLGENEENFNNFAQKLETMLVRELDRKIKENSKTPQRIRNFLKYKSDFYSVNLENAIQGTLIELGLPVLPDYIVLSDSKVTPKHFTGKTWLWEYQKDATYTFGQTNKSNGIKAQKKMRLR